MQMRSLGLFALAATLGAASIALTADDPAAARHEAMEHVGDAMKTLGAMARGQAPFAAATVKQNATTIADRLGEAASLFPAGSATGTSRAKPEIWANKADFDKLMADGKAAATALAAVTDEAAYRPALGALGQNCKACHDKYRAPEK